VHAQLVALARNLLANFLQQDLLIELLALLGVEIGCEDASRGVGGVWCPVLGHGQHEEGGPHAQGGEDLEGFGERTRLVAREKTADPVKEEGELGVPTPSGFEETYLV